MPADAQLRALLADLNDPQRAAVLHRDGPLLVIAGPGSGKTRVITRRAAYLVHSGVAAHNILAITFTNKATEEMRRRVEALGVARGMWVYTFHALGVRLLREFGGLAQLEPTFTIYDEEDSGKVVRLALETARVPQTVLTANTARQLISDAKARLYTPDELAARAGTTEDDALVRAYAAYEALLRQRNAVDFDDLLTRVARVLRDHPDVAARLNVRFRYLLIDEYQDTNYAQYVIARALSEQHGNICATGDPDQSIYAWRGADIRNILEFERDFPSATVVRLEQNYRSTPQVLRVAARLIERNRARKPKSLWTAQPDGAPVRVWRFSASADEAERIAATIRELHLAEQRPWSDFAIFYRVNALSRGLEEALRLRGIPYRIARGVEFYNRKEIKDVLAYLRLLVNPADDLALLRIVNTPARGIGRTTIDKVLTVGNETGAPLARVIRDARQIPALQAVAGRLASFAALLAELQAAVRPGVADTLGRVLERSGLEEFYRRERESGGEDRLANIQELVSAALHYESEVGDEASLADFLQRIALVSDQDAVDEQAGTVMLMTLHAAKGLEFDVVFLAGLEQGLLPHDRALASYDAAQREHDLEEERRLCFVGMTRARARLHLSFADERMIRGRFLPRSMSQFILEVDEADLEWRNFQRYTTGARYDRPGFIPLADDLPPEEAARFVARRRFRPPPEFAGDEELQREDGDRGQLAADDVWRADGLPIDEHPARPGADRPEPPVDAAGPPNLRRPQPPSRPADQRTVVYDDAAGPPRRTVPGRRRAAADDALRTPGPADVWSVGTRVAHEVYGQGEVTQVQRTGHMTRLVVRFAQGERTIILEYSKLQRLDS